jgi:hypothetical protein
LVEHLGSCDVGVELPRATRANGLALNQSLFRRISMVHKFSLLLAVAAALVIPTAAMAAHGGAHAGARGGGGHVMSGHGGHYAYVGGRRDGAYRGYGRGYGYGGPAYGYGGCVGLPVPLVDCF